MDLPVGKGLWRPFAVLGAAAAYLTFRWDAIPRRWVIHWDFAGRPNGWAHRTPMGVFGPVALAAGLVLFAEALAAFSGSRRGAAALPEPVRVATQSLVRTMTLALSLVLAFLAVDLPLGPRIPPGAIVGLSLVVFGGALAVGVARVRSASRQARWLGHTEKEIEGYHGLYYSSANDRRLWVPKRYGVGWTVNFAHPWAWPATLVVVGVPVAVVILASYVTTHAR
jgi:uncharacterized membrane protein